jgi:uncharacterized metal-binding protein YceD (DUF177 family)
MSSSEAKPEFSRGVPVERIAPGWRTETIAATSDERAALAHRFGLVELPRFEATVRLRRTRAGRYVEVDGTLRAAVVQTCVVTLDPVTAEIDERFALLLGPIGVPVDGEDDVVVDIDAPEPLDGDDVDIGELAAQQLSLALDPYPRSAEAADAPSPASDDADPRPADRPFAALQSLRKPQ